MTSPSAQAPDRDQHPSHLHPAPSSSRSDPPRSRATPSRPHSLEMDEAEATYHHPSSRNGSASSSPRHSPRLRLAQLSPSTAGRPHRSSLETDWLVRTGHFDRPSSDESQDEEELEGQASGEARGPHPHDRRPESLAMSARSSMEPMTGGGGSAAAVGTLTEAPSSGAQGMSRMSSLEGSSLGVVGRSRRVSWHAALGSRGLSDAEDVAEASGLTARPVEALAKDDAGEPAQGSSWKKRRRNYLVIYGAVFCVAYVTSLDANTGYLYLNFACSEFGALASFSTIAIVQQICYAIAKPPIAKLSDVFGRAEAYFFALVLYVGGYFVIATAPSLPRLIGGIVLQATGNTGVQVLQSIIIADTSTPQWRGLLIGIVNIPYLLNFAVAGPLVNAVMSSPLGWRGGFALWMVILPIAASPLLVTLIVGQRRARKAGLLEPKRFSGRSCLGAVKGLAAEIDLVGLVLFSAGWLLILLPLTLSSHGRWESSSLVYLAAGVALLGAFSWWEGRTSQPIMPYRLLTNSAVVCVCLIGVLDFASFYLSWTFLSSFVQVLKGWDQTLTGYFATTQNVTSTAVGILVGWAMAATRRYKTLLVWGIVVRLVGVSMMIKYRDEYSPTFMLVMCQLLQGIGGGSVAITMQVAVQCAVRHADLAVVTAMELLTVEVGAAIGSAAAGLIFSTHLPAALRSNLPQLPEEDIAKIYGSLSAALSYPLGSEVRQGIIDSWVSMMHVLCIVASLALVPAIFLAVILPDAHLPDAHHHHHHHHHHGSSTLSRRNGRTGSSSHASTSSARWRSRSRTRLQRPESHPSVASVAAASAASRRGSDGYAQPKNGAPIIIDEEARSTAHSDDGGMGGGGNGKRRARDPKARNALGGSSLRGKTGDGPRREEERPLLGGVAGGGVGNEAVSDAEEA